MAVLARAQQDAVWDRTQAHDKLRSALRRVLSPAILAAFAAARGGILRPEARMMLAAAPPRPPGRQADQDAAASAAAEEPAATRGIDAEAARLQAFGAARSTSSRWSRRPWAARARRWCGPLDATCANADELEKPRQNVFEQHPDAKIITSFPGLGDTHRRPGARRDRRRPIPVRRCQSLKAYAGPAPVTRGHRQDAVHQDPPRSRTNGSPRPATSGRSQRLTASPGARAHYDRAHQAKRPAHRRPAQPLQPHLLGCLHHCLITGKYDETTPSPTPAKKTRAA